MQLQRGCMPRPLAVWKRLTSRLERAAASEIELKLALGTARRDANEAVALYLEIMRKSELEFNLALDTARSEVKEVCMQRDQAVALSQEMVMERLDRYQPFSGSISGGR